MSYGRMIEKLEFLAPNLSPDGSGGTQEDLQVVRTMRGMVTPATSNRLFQSEESVLIFGKNFTVFYDPGFTPNKTHVIRYRGGLYTINGITEIREKRRMLRIYAFEQE